MVKHVLLLAIAVAACTAFQNPDIVVDIRVIALEADLPEQVIDVDFLNPPTESQLLAEIKPATVCALVADPYNMRSLRWSMTLCNYNEDERCDDNGDPQEPLGSGIEPDPDVTVPEPSLCATVQPDATLAAVLQNALSNDPLNGLQGLDYEVVLRVGGVDGDPTLDLYAEKTLQLAARVPADRVANNNPYISGLTVALGAPDSEDLGSAGPLPLGRCVDQELAHSAFVVPAGMKARITPIEPPGVREVYVLPTLDGSAEQFTESITYQWTATAGSFSDDMTGGPRDLAGNLPQLFTDWDAPTDADLAGSAMEVPLWVVQRDERYGVHWYESCLRVEP